MAKKKWPKGMPPSRRPERQTKHPTSYSVPMGTLTMPSDEELLGLANVVRMLVYVGRCAHWTAGETRSRIIAEVKQAFVDKDPSEYYRVLRGSITRSGEPEPYYSFEGAIRLALKHIGFGRTDEWALERVMAVSQRVIEAALIETVPAGYANIRIVDDIDFV